jgi:hypothetical protein
MATPRALEAPDTPESLVIDVSAPARPDLGMIEALARLALLARRLGCQVQVRDASPELGELLGFAGLAEVVRCVRPSVGEVQG